MSEGAAERPPLASLVAVIGGLTVAAVTAGYNAPLFSTRLDAMGHGDSAIGWNAAANAVAPFFMAPLAPAILARWGLPRTMIAAAFLEAALFLACLGAPGFWGWSAIRLAMGAIGGVSWVAGEVWIAAAAPAAARGRILAVYNSCFAAGTAAGPLFLGWVGPAGALPFVAAAVLLALSAIPVIWARRLAPAMKGAGPRPSIGMLVAPVRRCPAPMALNLVYALIFMALWTFLPVYAVDTGYDVGRAYRQLTAFAVGSIALQLPIGWAVDRGGGRATGLLLLAVTLAAVAALDLFVRNPLFDLAYFFVLGGAASGLYVVALAIIGATFRGAGLSAAIAAFTLMWSVGALAGPPVVGAVNDLLGPAGLPVSLALFAAAFMPMVARDWWRHRGRP